MYLILILALLLVVAILYVPYKIDSRRVSGATTGADDRNNHRANVVILLQVIAVEGAIVVAMLAYTFVLF